MNENLKVMRDLVADLEDASKGMATKYSQNELEKTLREESIKFFGKANPTILDLDRNPNSGMFFEIIEQFIGSRASDQLAIDMPFAEIVTLGWGEKIEFEIEHPDLFDVCTVASGNGNVRRQRIENGYLTIPTEAKAIKIFDSFKRFLTGKANWTQMMDKVVKSYVKHVKELVWTAFYASAPVNGNAVFNVNDAGGFDSDSVYTMVDHVQAENMGSEIIIVGTRSALKNLTPVIATEQANKDMYEMGYYKTAEGYNLVPVDQMHIKNTFDFLLTNKQLMIIPADLGSIVKILEEGQPVITNKNFTDTADMSVEYFYYREVGIGVVTGLRYGKYTWE